MALPDLKHGLHEVSHPLAAEECNKAISNSGLIGARIQTENLKNIASVEPREVTNQEFLQCYLIRASNIHFLRQAPRKLNYNI